MHRAPEFAANHLLAALRHADRDRLTARMLPMRLSRGQTLSDADAEPFYTYFPISGLTSILSVTRRGQAVGIAAVGREGAIGWPLVFPGQLHRVVVEVPGRAHRIRSELLRAEFRNSDALQLMLLDHTQHVMARISRSVACQRFHTVPERLACWLLLVWDHAGSNRFRLTQAAIARVLGIQRTGVTAAASALKRAGVIWYRHGQLVVVSRRRLEREACDCYRASPGSATRVPSAAHG